MVMAFLAVVFVFGANWWHDHMCRNGLNQWAKSEGLTLLEVRYVWFFQGPDAWRRSRKQTQYRVKVWDAQGRILHVWVTLGTYWGFMDWYKVSNVVWR
jgi:hypothetical protein